MKVDYQRKDDCAVCQIEGEINLNTSPELRRVFDDCLRTNIKKVIINFSAVPYIDSSGLATLIELFQRLKKIDGKLRICSVPDKIRDIFELTKLHKLFEVYDDEASAMENF